MSRRFSIRAKLTVGALIPLVAAIVVCSLAGLWIISSKVKSQAQDKVRVDLNSAREVYGNELNHITELVQFAAGTPFAAAAIDRKDRSVIGSLLVPLQESKHLDLLLVVDRNGQVLFRAHDPSRFGDTVHSLGFVNRALQGERVSGTVVIPPDVLTAENPQLAARAAVRVLPTPLSRQKGEEMERAGMALVSASPVRDKNGVITGAVCGLVLLNKNNSLVDRIKEIVYEGVQFEGQDVGTATIFLDDTRIATNVLATDRQRAIGTRLSEEVYRRVILEKKKWVGRAFVVNDWYLTAYEPILDPEGKAIGSLYVGMLEKPYAALKVRMNLIYGSILLIAALLGVGISGIIGSRLARPIREMETLARRVAKGERGLTLKAPAGDELGDLAAEFNEMTRALAQREDEIGALNRSLEAKVVERTAQLEEKNLQLLRVQADLARAEKLADLGVVAAGVAHEMNNPLAIIRGNTEVLDMYIPEDSPGREEVGIISAQTDRMAKIVSSLLTFARQKPMQREKVNLPRLLDQIVEQVGHQVDLGLVTVERKFSPGVDVIEGDGDKLRQVFTNLVVNGVQAMPSGGVLTLEVSREDDGSCTVSVGDTGIGIPPENVDKVFTPFFTTRDEGTGLGLSVSYGIVKDHKGKISVASVEGKGTVFCVILPTAPLSEPPLQTPEEWHG